MTFLELQKKADKILPAILLEHFISHSFRRKIKSILFFILVFIFLFILLDYLKIDSLSFIENLRFQLRSSFILIFTFWLGFYLLDAMYFSFYFAQDNKIDFEVAQIVSYMKEDDVTKAFLDSEIGKYTMLRLGISQIAIDDFLKMRQDKVTMSEYVMEDDDFVTLKEFGQVLIHYDSEFREFLIHCDITAEVFVGTLNFVSRVKYRLLKAERWWSRDALRRIPSIGRNWSFGKVFLLEEYGHSIFSEQAYQRLGNKWRIYQDEVNKLEQILVKDSGSNIMLISEESNLSMEVVSSLAREILEGTTLPELESKRLFVLDASSLIDSMKDKATLENTLKKIFIQSSRAGNVILVIPAFSDFVAGAHSVGSDIKDLISEALNASNLQLVAVTNNRSFHETIETDKDLMIHFEKVLLDGLGERSLIELIQDEAQILESRFLIFFTFQSLLKVASSVKQYFVGESLNDKVVDILNEVSTKALTGGKHLILDSDIDNLIEEKTGVPQGAVKAEEKDKLQNLETELHKRVIGQESAISAISNAMRRSRAGLNNPDKPIGSFLFLGPSGVGKTESTKALAQSYFGNEENIIRLDMSEYTGADALKKLIGSFDGNNAGILTMALREKQYGILLLDEFEKTTDEVHNLFLQVLDEGFFTDGRGEKVNARNLIIIATSNAGSQMIYDETVAGEDVSKEKDLIIREIIKQGTYRPELVNRFDDVIVFHPLMRDHLKEIAKLMINKLNKRLENKTIVVEANDELLEYLVERGIDPQFGARAMNRVIQEELEKIIADNIISGNVSSGDKIIFKVKGELGSVGGGNSGAELFLEKIS